MDTEPDAPGTPEAPWRAFLSNWGPRLLVWGVVYALVAAAVVGYFGARHLVEEQERRALNERAATIEASLRSSEQSILASFKVLAAIASTQTPGAYKVFDRVAAGQRATASAVGAARVVDGRYIVVAGAGSVRPGAPLSAERRATLARARVADGFVVTLEYDPPRLVLALSVGDLVVFQENPLSAGPQGSSPFGSVDVALYASLQPRSERLVFTTAALPLRGVQTARAFTVGIDTWLLVAASEDPLAGTLTRRVPWIVLVSGLLAALLVGLVLNTLSRRRTYALRMVAERTSDLEDSQRFQERLLTSGPMLVARSRTPDLAITYMSPNAGRVLGIRGGGQALDVTQRDKGTHPDDLPALRHALQSVTSGAVDSASLEMRARIGRDTYRWMSTRIVPERDPDTGEVTAVLSYVLDIDDRKMAEQSLRAAQEAAESANQAKSDFLSRMSHELRTPMNAVLGFGQLLELDELTPSQRESIGFILSAGRHLLLLIDDVLDISRIEAGTVSLSAEPVLPSDVISGALQLVQPMADERQVVLRFDPPRDEPHMLADHHRLNQILLNLLSNAIKYNVQGGRVTVSLKAIDEDRVRIDVADTGPGIPREHRNLLFRPFERLGAEKSQVEGTGIGLALSRQLAEAMGGHLTLVDSVGGSIFSVELPRCEPILTPTDTEELPAERNFPMPTLSRACVLQIEDNPSNVRLMERLLEDRKDIELLVAPLGRLGIDLAREHQPKLILLDLHLPDLHGEEVLAELLADPATAGIPVVVVSADGMHGQERRLREAGAHAYLTKPFNIADLLTLIDASLSLSAARGKQALE